MERNSYDIIIIGGGIMGCSTAYHLMRNDPRLKVSVIESDPTYARASTTLSLANARVQFSLKENVRISRYTFETFERFGDEMEVDGRKPKIDFRPEGNLFVVSKEGRPAAEKALSLQKSLECTVEWLPPEKIKERYPLYEISGFEGGTFGPEDGHFDAHSFLMGYRNKARSLGVEFIKDEVVAVKRDQGRVSGARLASGANLISEVVVNCAGAWAAKIARTIGIELPVAPVKRQIFALDPSVKSKEPLPLTILPSGLYFRTETGGLILLGKSMGEDPV